MSVVSELISAIEADPHDEASQLVIADYLQAEGDPRGDLIILDHAERRGMLEDPAALDQLLLLAGVYSFPRADPAEPMLAFTRQESSYVVVHGEYRYTLEDENDRRDGDYLVTVEPLVLSDGEPEGDDDDPRRYHWVDVDLAPPWSEEQRTITLTIISDAIRAGTPLDDLRFPFNGILSLPQYEGSPWRCYTLPIAFLKAHELLRNQFGLAARDYHRWHAIWNRLRAMQRG